MRPAQEGIGMLCVRFLCGLALLLLGLGVSSGHAHAYSAPEHAPSGTEGGAHPAGAPNAPRHASLALSSTRNPAPIGAAVTFSVNFPDLPDGTAVVFRIGSSALGSSSLKSGTASLSTSFSSTGNYPVTAVAGTSSSVQASHSSSIAQQVLPASTSTTLAPASNLVVGSAAKLTATISGASPTGTVVFTDGGVSLGKVTLSGGAAALSAAFTAAGSHVLQASYSGDARNAASTSTLTTVSVAPASSTTTLAASANPVVAGVSLTLTAKVTSPSSNGTVTFFDGSTTLGTATLSGGTATLGTSFATPGSHSLSASFNGNSAVNASTSAALSVTVKPATSATTLAASANPVVVGHAVVLTAKVSGATNSGSVTFKDGSTTLASVALNAGVASYTTTFTSTGTHALSAAFGGTSVLAASTSPTLSETVSASTTSVSLSASPNPASVGQAIRLSATVSGASPSGTVTFKDGSTTLGSATLGSNGQASFNATMSTVGTHSLSASYAGNATNLASTSAVQTLAVQPATTQTSLSASNTAFQPGQSTTLTARVTGSNPTGTVTFRSGSSTLGSASLSSGAASLTVGFASSGTYNVVASYAGNSTNAASSSQSLPLVVGSSTGGKPPQTGNGIDYSGGPVMNTGAALYFIWYGNWNGSPVPNVLNNFANGVGGSNWYHINTTYSDNSGNAVNDSVTLLGSTSDNYSQGKTLSDNGVFNVVSKAITGGSLPLDPNGVYVVFSSADVAESSGFCTNYCGWHTSASLSGVDIKFAFVGSTDRCPSACSTGATPPNGSVAGDAMASVLGHELAETVTDPDLNAWFTLSSGEETGDLCAWNFGATSTESSGGVYNLTLPTGKFLIQQIWLNAQGGRCALSYP